MPKLSTCKSCGKKLLPEEKNIHSSKTYCNKCYEKIKRESDEYKLLIEFICKNYEIDQPTGFMLKQIKEMKEELSYSYAAMTYTLWYCKDIIGKNLISQYGITLVRYYYEEAKDYYIQQEENIKRMKELENVELKIKIIKQNKTKSNTNNSMLFNLDNLLKGGDDH